MVQQECDGGFKKKKKKMEKVTRFLLMEVFPPTAVILENSGLVLFKFLENEIKLGLGERLNKNDSYGCVPLKSCIFVSDNCKLKNLTRSKLWFACVYTPIPLHNHYGTPDQWNREKTEVQTRPASYIPLCANSPHHLFSYLHTLKNILSKLQDAL